jgi:Flp pilus assembly protein TadG
LGSEDGGATVEFTLLVPAFLSLMLFTADTSMIFLRQSSIWNVSQETARIVARHGLDIEDAEAFARDRLRLGDYTPDVAISIDQPGQLVTVLVTARSSKLAPFGFLSRTMADTVSVSVSQSLEPT